MAGGAGAAFGELGAEWTHNADLGRIIGSGAGFILSDGDAEPVNIANLMASNAIENNWYQKMQVQWGGHFGSGVAVGKSYSKTILGEDSSEITSNNEVIAGVLLDAGAGISLLGDDKYSGPATYSIGYGKFLGVQITPSNSLAAKELLWYDLSRYFNGISVGIGIPIPSSPVTVSAPINNTTDKNSSNK